MTSAVDDKKKSILMNDVNQDIPIFLRKTYHMIDTCDKVICSWSEDGETFVVMNPTKFEKEIIPQFFKHNKFSSFVRQLNFYAFRKIKTNNNIRIDPALEAKTANFWRFYHPKFQRGRPDWLKEIKRSSSTPRGGGGAGTLGTSNRKKGGGDGNGTTANGRNNSNNNNNNSTVVPDATSSSLSSSVVVVGGRKDDSELKSEVTTLKERIEAMNKNIDLLTTMVQNVTLAQQTTSTTSPTTTTSYEEGEENYGDDDNDVVFNGNNKRSKISSVDDEQQQQQQATTTKTKTTCCVPDEMISSSSALSLPSLPSLTFSTAAVEQPRSPIMPSLMMSSSDGSGGACGSNLFNKEMRQSSELSDEGFVDTLFTAFKGEDDDSVVGELMMTDADMGTTTTINDANATTTTTTTTTTTDTSTITDDATSNSDSMKLNHPWLTSTSISSITNENENQNYNYNNTSNQQRQRRPRTELMNRLSDALSLLPRDIQELIVDRLIHAITSPKEIQLSLNVANALKEVAAATTTATANTDGLPVSTVPQSPKHKHINDESQILSGSTTTTAAAAAVLDTTSMMMTDDDGDDDDDDDYDNYDISTAMDYVTPPSASAAATTAAIAMNVNVNNNPTLPLAAATLAALLSQYGKEQQCGAAVAIATQQHVNKSSKVLIPVHA